MAQPHVQVQADHLLRIRMEYLEMPGLSLTVPQAQRLWGLDRTTCEAALDVLVDARFLRRRCNGMFVRFELNSPTA
jgi:hypothetical protein